MRNNQRRDVLVVVTTVIIFGTLIKDMLGNRAAQRLPGPRITGDIGHVVMPGETLATIAQEGGSTPALIACYNRLVDEPQPGRALIVPTLTGRPATLSSMPLLVKHERIDKPWDALPFDADAGLTSRMLEQLRDRRIMLTLFLSGRWIKGNPEHTRQITGYIGHVVAPGETLATIAQEGGSTPALIACYNRLVDEPQPGRALIVPTLAGHPATLSSVPLLVKRGRTDKPWVALTFDADADDDAGLTSRMLEDLRDRRITLTFFLSGKWIKENPKVTRQIAADGHEIANHTFYTDLTRLSAPAIRKELGDTEELLRQTAGVSSRPLFRPPSGSYNEQVLWDAVALGYLPVSSTIDSLDSLHTVGLPITPEFLFKRVTNKLTPEELNGAIILMHCDNVATARALPLILDRFDEMGFEVKKVSEILP